MMIRWIYRSLILSAVAYVLIMALGCGGESDTYGDNLSGSEVPQPPVTTEPKVITIGNHTDVTGVAANAMGILTAALEDTAQYYTEHSLVPGISFKVITYDNQYNPAKDVPGYEWLKERGADIIFSPVASTAVALKPRLEKDRTVLYTVAPNPEAFDPPGWVFAAGNTCVNWEAQTLLKWIAENDPDFPRDRPAKVGGAFWNESYGIAVLKGAEAYARTHPDQFEWRGSHLTNFSFNWTTEVDALKDCDYVFPPVPMTAFLKQWQEAGHPTKFIGTDAHICFLKQIDDAGLWEVIDGMLLIRPALSWGDDGSLIEMAKEMLYRYRPHQAHEIMQWGPNYLSVQQQYVMFELIRKTIESVGAGGFTAEALYNVAQGFSIELDGCPHSYSETKRTSNDALAIYKVRASEKDIIWTDHRWHPIVYTP